MEKIYLIQTRTVFGPDEMSDWSNLYAVKTEEEAKADIKGLRDEMKARSFEYFIIKKYYKYEEVELF